MRQDVIADDAHRFRRMNTRLHRQARQHCVHLGDRVNAYEPLILLKVGEAKIGDHVSSDGLLSGAIRSLYHRLKRRLIVCFGGTPRFPFSASGS
jgi:hypothetical protein